MMYLLGHHTCQAHLYLRINRCSWVMSKRFVVCVLLQDYGIWERGDKTNQGIPELNATSIGMAKVMSKQMI